MGEEDKAFVELDDRPLLFHVLSFAPDLFDEQVLVTNHPEKYRTGLKNLAQYKSAPDPASVLMTMDREPGGGPLVGLEAGLREANEPVSFVSGCDMPFLSKSFVLCLLELFEGMQSDRSSNRPMALIPVLDEKPQTLCALYESRAFRSAEEALHRGISSVRGFLGHLQVEFVSADHLEGVPDPERLFTNINTPNDLEDAKTALPDQENDDESFTS